MFMKDVSDAPEERWIPPSQERSLIEEQSAIYRDKDVVIDESVEKLDMAMLVDIALEKSPETRKAWHAARIASAEHGKSLAVYFPQVTISAIGAKTQSDTPGGKSVMTHVYPGIEIQYSLFKFGGDRQRAKAAKQLLYAANYQHNRAIQDVVAGVTKAYCALDSAIVAHQAAKKNLDDAFIAYDQAFTRNQAGLAPLQEFLQAKANKSRAEYQLENAVAKIESARATLAKLVGVEVTKNFKIETIKEENYIDDIDVDVSSLVALALDTRPDVAAEQASVIAKKDLIWTSKTEFLPEVVAGFSGDIQKYKHHGGHYKDYNAYVGLQWKLFNGMQDVYNCLEAEEQLKIAEENFRAKKLEVASEIWSSYHTFKGAQKQLTAARTYENVAKESFDSTTISYKNGLCSFHDLMSAQTELANAREQTVYSRNLLLTSVMDLVHALGADENLEN